MCVIRKQIITDPTAIEEKVADSLLQLSINSYREICGMHFEGVPLPSSDIVVQCTINAVLVATQLIKQIKQALIEDEQRRWVDMDTDFFISGLLTQFF